MTAKEILEQHAPNHKENVPVELALAAMETYAKSNLRRNKGYNPEALKQILNEICEAESIDMEDLTSKSRKGKLVYCRQVYCWVARYKTDQHLRQIGIPIQRHHTSVIHAIRSVDDGIASGWNEAINLLNKLGYGFKQDKPTMDEVLEKVKENTILLESKEIRVEDAQLYYCIQFSRANRADIAERLGVKMNRIQSMITETCSEIMMHKELANII